MIGVTYAKPRVPKLGDSIKRSDKRHWVTADGRRLRVSEMEVPHLVNTVRLLRRHSRNAQLARLASLSHAAMMFQGDGALDAINAEFMSEISETDDEFLSRAVRPYDAMLRRLARLKIDVKTYRDPRVKRRFPRRAIEDSAPDELADPPDWDNESVWGKS